MQLFGLVVLAISLTGQLSDFRQAMAELAPFQLPVEADLVLVSRLESAVNMATEPPEREKLLSHLAVARVQLAEVGDEGSATYANAALDDLVRIEARYRTEPNFHRWRMQAKYRAGTRVDEIHTELDRLIEKFPKSPELRRCQGDLYLVQCDIRKVESIYRAVTELDPLDGDAKMIHGYALFHLNENEQALSELRKGLAFSENPKCRFDLAYIAMAGLFMDAGEVVRAEKLARMSIAATKGDPFLSFFAFWETYSNAGRHHSAFEIATSVLTHSPTHGRLLALKAISQLNLARPELALKYAEAGYKSDSKAFMTCWALGRTLAANGDYIRAARALHDAESAPDRALHTRQMWDCQLRRALILTSAGDKQARDGQQALRLCEVLVAQSESPENKRLASLVAACAHAETGDFASALKIVRTPGQPAPGNPNSQRAKSLETLFTKNQPHRISIKDPGAIQIPLCGFISGRLRPLTQHVAMDTK